MSHTIQNIVILDCNEQVVALQPKFGSNGDMHQAYICKYFPHATIHQFEVINNHFPENIAQYDLVIITGSRYSVYDNFPWMLKLQQVIQQIYNNPNQKIFGACFGHQIITQALGGEVEKSDQGWGLGLSNSKIIQRQTWMQPWQQSLSLSHIHQDQVMSLPENAQLYATSDHCQFEGYTIGNTVITHQGHPEFSTLYLGQLLEHVQKDRALFPSSIYQQAITSLNQPNHEDLFGTWVHHFLTQ